MPETTTQEKQSENFEIRQEAIVNIALSELYDFPNHPFKVRDDEAMQETAESIRQYGVLVPAIVRPREEGGYEIIAGHRRKHGSELAGLKKLPCIIREIPHKHGAYEPCLCAALISLSVAKAFGSIPNKQSANVFPFL